MYSSNTNEHVVNELYSLLSQGKYDDYFALLSDDIVYYAAGHCMISGIHKGKEQLRKIGYTTFKETNGTHRVEFVKSISGGSHVAVVDIWRARRNNRSIEMKNIIVYKVESNKICEIHEFIGDETAHDEFWSQVE